MATHLSIDADWLEHALDAGGERSKKDTVPRALEEFIARRTQRRLRELMDSLEWDTRFDSKAGRQRP